MAETTISSKPTGTSSRVKVVAQKIERHIRASALKPGDRYITAEEGGRLLGESVMTVHRAMSFLARQKILDRRPKAGTFVGEAVAPQVTMSCVHFLLPEQLVLEKHFQEEFWSQIHGIRSILPDVSVQFNFIPNQDVGYAQEVVTRTSAAGSLLGVVLILPSRKMRAFFNTSGIATVVAGGVEDDLTSLCWFNWDQVQIGRLLTTHLLDRGVGRIVTVMRDVWSIGEHQLHDGISEVMSHRGLPANALLVRSAPSERSAIMEMVRGTLNQVGSLSTGFICRTEFQADCVSEIAQELGVADRLEVTTANPLADRTKPKYTSIVPEIGGVEVGRLIGSMIKDMSERKPVQPRGRQIAVRLCTASPAAATTI